MYPIVCSTAAKTEMALGVLKRDFLSLQVCEPFHSCVEPNFVARSQSFSLQDRCRATVLSQLTHEEQIDQLKLPLRIKHFISEGLENFQVGNIWKNSFFSCETIVDTTCFSGGCGPECEQPQPGAEPLVENCCHCLVLKLTGLATCRHGNLAS